MFGNLFGPSNKFTSLKEDFSAHEKESSQKLHFNHPHVGGLMRKYNLNLRNIRRKGVKVVAAASIMGAFLAIPFLIGHPKNIDESTVPPEVSSTRGYKGASGESSGASGGEISQNITLAARESSQKDSNGKGVVGSSENKVANLNDAKSQGHRYGRSYLAPPEEHGLHDLGLHRGEDKSQGKSHEGPHPEELNVKHKNGEKT